MRKQYFYKTYSPILGKWFKDWGFFESESDFRLFMYANFSGNWQLEKVV